MDVIQRLWPRLADSQRKLLESMAVELAGAPKARDDEWLTVAQIAKRYDKSPRTIYAAQDKGVLEYRTPNGIEKPRYSRRSDVEAWLFGK